MKIERISENQIRCTLNKHDLMERHLKISELAYGSDKAKELFRDMMEQANIDLGFEADDIPLMIEAIPTSRESIILVITKVEDPEEFDEKFSRFGIHDKDFDVENEDIFDAEEDVDESSMVDMPEELSNCFEQLHDLLQEAAGKDTRNSSEFVPLRETLTDDKTKKKKSKKKKTENISDSMRVFSFPTLQSLINVAHLITPQYVAKNSLWRDSVGNRYYLLLNRGHNKQLFHSVCATLSEFGKEEHVTYATQAYYNEHFQMVIKDKALVQLADF